MENTVEIINIIAEQKNSLESERDRDFLQRVYQGGLDFYIERLNAIGFTGRHRVLDAGCGFGQWSMSLANLNTYVDALDYSEIRVNTAKKFSQALSISNLSYAIGSIEELPYSDETFDAVFCYSTIYQTDYNKTLQSFHRILKSNGILYFSTNSWGWYIFNLVNNHNPSKDFSPRKHAIKTILNTLRYRLSKKYRRNVDLIMPVKDTIDLLKEIGFKDIQVSGDGRLVRDDQYKPRPVYAEKYFGLENVYEIVGAK
ncbi:class I SAM-dependent methyltransferase [Chloroflexota bacterium]